MTVQVYQQPNIVKVVYDATLKSLIVEWTYLGPHKSIRPCTMAQLKAIQENRAKAIIVNTANATGVAKKEDLKWFDNYLFGELEKAGLKAIITVIPQDALTRLSASYWKNTGKTFGIEFLETATLEKAKELVSEYT